MLHALLMWLMLSCLQDYEGQRLSEQIMQWLIIAAAVSACTASLPRHLACRFLALSMIVHAGFDILTFEVNAKVDSLVRICMLTFKCIKMLFQGLL